MKTISKGLILALVIQFALILPFVNIVGVEKAKAEEPGPVAPPTAGSVGMTFLSGNQGRILVKYYYADGDSHAVELNFNREGPLVSGSETPQSQFLDTLWGIIASQGITTDFVVYSYEGDANKKLIIGKKNASDTLYYNCGLYQKTILSGGKYAYADLIKRNDNTGQNENVGGPGGPINSTNSSTGYLGKKINTTASTEQLCTQLTHGWTRLLENMKAIIGSDPKDTPAYWDRNTPPGWRQAINMSIITQSLRFGPIALGLAAGGTTLVNRLSGYDGSYNLNDAGMTKAEEIRTVLAELKTIGENINTGTDAWPTSPVNCRPAKITDTLESSTTEFFDKPSEFVAFCVELGKVFENAIREGEGSSDDICGNALNNLSKIFPWMFCKLGEIVHMIAVSIINKSIGWLEASIGIDEIRFEKSNLDTDSLVDHQNTTTQDQIREAAVALCNEKKPPTTAQADWDRGPCLTSNMNNTGYAVDIAHSPRTEVDNQNVCPSPTKWIELNTSCSIIGQRH